MIYDISYKTLICAKPLQIRFDKVDGFNRVYDGNRFLTIFGPERYDAINNRIRYLANEKGGVTYVFFHNNPKIKIDLYNSFPLAKTLL